MVKTELRKRLAIRGSLVGLSFAAALCIGQAQAQSPDAAAREVFKRMTDYVSSLPALSFDYSVDMEAVTTAGIKLQFSASGQLLLDRPNRFRVVRTGGHSDIELVSDGDTITLYGRRKNLYAQNAAPRSLDDFVNKARSERGVEFPGADLLLTNVHDELIEPVIDAMYLGTGFIDDVECEHLAFRTAEVDWQIWVATGARPYPCKYVVTSKWTTAAPQYQMRIRNWNDRPNIGAEAFAFKPSDGARQIDLADIGHTDVVLPETLQGARK